MPRTEIKAKKSYTLSKDSVAFLEALRKKHRARSVSAVLEDLVQQARQDEQKRAYEAQVTAYYDSLTEEEREENRAWADFSMSQLTEKDF